MNQRTISQKDIQEKWYILDASNTRIGKIATMAAQLLQGKNDPLYRPNLKANYHVVVVNADKIDFTDKRGFSKFYKSYSGFPSGLTHISLDEKFEKNKAFPVENAVRGMLPKTKRGREMITNLRVYAESTHPHDAQQPVSIDLNKYNI